MISCPSACAYISCHGYHIFVSCLGPVRSTATSVGTVLFRFFGLAITVVWTNFIVWWFIYRIMFSPIYIRPTQHVFRRSRRNKPTWSITSCFWFFKWNEPSWVLPTHRSPHHSYHESTSASGQTWSTQEESRCIWAQTKAESSEWPPSKTPHTHSLCERQQLHFSTETATGGHGHPLEQCWGSGKQRERSNCSFEIGTNSNSSTSTIFTTYRHKHNEPHNTRAHKNTTTQQHSLVLSHLHTFIVP